MSLQYVVPLLIFSVLLGVLWVCLPIDRTPAGRVGWWSGWLALVCLGGAVLAGAQD